MTTPIIYCSKNCCYHPAMRSPRKSEGCESRVDRDAYVAAGVAVDCSLGMRVNGILLVIDSEMPLPNRKHWPFYVLATIMVRMSCPYS